MFMSGLASKFHSCTWMKLLRVCLFVYMFINFEFTTLIENVVCIYLLWLLNLVEVTHTSKQGKSRTSFQYLSSINIAIQCWILQHAFHVQCQSYCNCNNALFIMERAIFAQYTTYRQATRCDE